jgi:hypothetical protein
MNCGRNELDIPCRNAIPCPISKANLRDIAESIVLSKINKKMIKIFLNQMFKIPDLCNI